MHIPLILLSCMLVHAQQDQQQTITPNTPSLDIHWIPFVPKYAIMPEGIISENAVIDVPQDYYAEYAEASATMHIRVRRYRHAGVNPTADKRAMLIIPGGPGQHANDVESWIPQFLSIVPPGTDLYLMDHRGTGKSAKITSSKRQEECMEDLGRCAAQSPVPLQVLSVHNAAMDFIAVTRSLKEVSKEQSWFIYGASYGALLANYIYRLAPTLYEGVMADSLAPELRAMPALSNDIRRHITDNCQGSQECRQWIDPGRISSLVTDILDHPNKCSDAFFQTVLIAIHLHDLQLNRGTRAAIIRLFIRLVIFRRVGVHPQASVLVFLRSTLECPNIAVYNASVNALVKSAAKSFAKSDSKQHQQSGSEVHFADEEMMLGAHSLAHSIDQLRSNLTTGSGHSSKKIKAAGTRSSNVLLHHMLVSEQTALDFRACLLADREANFLSVCDVRIHSLPVLHKWQPFMYAPKSPPQPSHSPSRYVLLASKIDTQTPFDRAAEEFKDLKAREKYMLVYDSMPHVVILRGSHCDKTIMGLLFGLNTESEARACIHDWNSRVTWRAGVHPLLRRLWDQQSPSYPMLSWLKYLLIVTVSMAGPLSHSLGLRYW